MVAGTATIRNGDTARAFERGMTLVEILVALGIMAIGLASALVLFGYAFRTHKQGVDRTEAALLAQAVFAETGAQLVSTNAHISKDNTHPDFPDIFLYDLEFEPIGDYNDRYADTVLVTVTVRWKVQGRERRETFTTIMRARREVQ